MNSDHIKGKAKEVAGEIQEHAGKLFGSKEQEVKGHIKEMEGKLQQKRGDVKDAVEEAVDDAKKFEKENLHNR